jgi:hypothetical protein
MYDPDYGSVGVIFQYSYSHDNSEGIYWGCNTRGGNNNTSGIPDPEDVGCTLRYCISQNDMGDLIFFNYPSAGNEIYNNVFYIKAGLSSKIIHESGTKNHTYNFFNNIIFDLGNATYAWGSGAGVQSRNFKNNVFFGLPVPTEVSSSDNQILTSNPLFVNPGQGAVGRNSLLDGYKLQVNSPALASGKVIATNGGRDFWMNNVNSITAPNRGAYQGAGILATESWDATTLKAFPNPVTGILNLSYTQDITTVKVYNLLGQELLNKEINANSAQIDLSDFTNGTYLIQVTSENKIKTLRVIKI